MLNNYYLSMALFVSVFVMLFTAYISWKRRKIPIALKLSLVMLAASVYTFGYAHEVTLSDLEGIKVCLMVEYIGIPFIPPLWLLMTLEYTGYRFTGKWLYSILFVIPVLTLLLQYTNDWHQLFYKSISIDYSGYFPMVYLKKGPWYWVHIAYSYLSVIGSIILLIVKYLKESSLYRKQIIILVLGAFIPWLLNLFTLLHSSKAVLDLTPFGFLFTGILFHLAIYRLNFLKISPIAFEKIFKSMSEGVIVMDFNNQIINYNESAVTIIPELKTGIKEEGDSLNLFKNYPVISETLQQSQMVETKFRLQRKEVLKSYKLELTFIYNKKLLLGKILVITDITDFERNIENLTQASAQLTALNTLKDRLINVVAKDIKEPLDMLLNLSDILKSQDSNGNNNQLISEIQKYVNNIFLRVDNMLEYFQNKQTGIIYSPMEWKLSKLAQEAVKTIREKAENKNIGIHLTIEDDLMVYADRGMLDIVLRNLLSNAVKFTDRNGSISITAEKEEDFIIISIKDTGIGMESEKVQLLFQDVDASPSIGTEGEVGIGLGLLLCSQIIKRNYGDIWVDSTFGEGSNFFIAIPAAGERFGFKKNITR
ncbi:histidine kinase N-terminal 7TM domain-containing protein [Anaerocolumna sp. AGMB13025]|uniref:sensor histidine kinase n=1 Tax=Anaerocolumna sp. AGMB13025 TaxID=3039116 RepID=UPI0024201FAE|nr:histidine kinase N-terminal 7TM domain-containing protein [Anaerocolumna sp. AGMB13025]WFR56110.1 histidine kinase N-terminal 7TM domain-containing protein [Anaerocolumna sp. AGMB13025]